MNPDAVKSLATEALDPVPRDAVIAIDGPAGSGKSTTARNLAERFGLLYIDTGAMYRALTLAAIRKGTDLADGPALTDLLLPARLELGSLRGDTTVHWNGLDFSGPIRSPEVDAAVSLVSSHESVRTEMVRRQQEFGRRGGVVMEGRDIGSVVFPLASTKIFLSAGLEARVQRRVRQYRQAGREVQESQVRSDLAERDRQDSQREVSPLAISPDSLVIDSSGMTLAQQNDACARACRINPTLDRRLDRDLEAARRDLPWHYRLAYAVFGAFSRFYGLKQVGNEGRALPRGCIVAVNHISFWDPPLVGSTLHRYRVHSLAKEELFRIWPMGPLFRSIDSIPIRRKGYDHKAFALAASALQAGNNLVIFPEGTRRAIGSPGPVRNGLGILVQATRAPMQPIFIRGSYGRAPGGSLESPLEVCFGPVVWWHGLDALLEKHDPKDVSRRIARLCEAIFCELQDRSFARHPRTRFEKELGDRQLRAFTKRQKKVFGTG